MTFLIYGATGYTGRLCAAHALERGLRPVLAGRNADTLRPFADGLDLEWRAFGLEPSPAQLQGIRAVLHAAGPFSATAVPIAAACIAAGIHYCRVPGSKQRDLQCVLRSDAVGRPPRRYTSPT